MHIQPLDHTQDLRVTAARYRLQVVSRGACCEVRHYYGGRIPRQVPRRKNFRGRDLDPGGDHHVPRRWQLERLQRLAHALDPARYDVEVVHLGEQPTRLPEAEAAGVKSVPALLIDGQPLHINFGASLADLR